MGHLPHNFNLPLLSSFLLDNFLRCRAICHNACRGRKRSHCGSRRRSCCCYRGLRISTSTTIRRRCPPSNSHRLTFSRREELMYWNAVHMEKLEKERKLNGDKPANRSRGSSFDDFLQEDTTAEKGTYVYNTGADVRGDAEEGLRNRNVRGLNRGSFYANPFSDEHNIDADEQRAVDSSLMSPEESEKVEVMSDLYSANEEPKETRQTTATIAEQLIDTSDAVPDPPVSYPMMEDTDYTNMAPRDDSAYASIHAWADNANNSFYSPLPATPRSASPRLEIVPGSPTFSDPDISVPGSGEATPTDSASLAGSGEEVWAPRSGATSEADVMSVDGEGISTPGSWTEVGSEVSENDVGVLHN